MSLSSDLATHFRNLHYGPNFTGVDLKALMDGVTMEEATTQVGSLNTIAKLVFHINYYVAIVLNVFEGGHIQGHDKYSYDCPPINTEADWQALVDKLFREADALTAYIEALPDSDWQGPFDTGKYGNNFRNINGLIEHTHYHMGQIALIRKMIREQQLD